MAENPATSEVRNVATYKTPILAIRNNRLVKLIATGDQVGKSPVCQYVDSDGNINWDSQREFRVIDLHFLPPGTETTNLVNNMARDMAQTR